MEKSKIWFLKKLIVLILIIMEDTHGEEHYC